MKNFHFKNSILVKFIFCVFLCLLVPLIIMIAITRTHISRIEQNTARQYLSANLNTVSSSIDGIINNVENFYIPLLTERSFTTTIEQLSPYASRNEYQDFLDTNLISNALSQTASFNNFIYSIYAYSYPANRFFSSKVRWDPAYHDYDKENSDWLMHYENDNPKDRWILTSSVEDRRPILTSYRSIKHDSTSLDGVISINIDATVISQQLQNTLPDSESFCFMTDSDFNMISSSDFQENSAPVYEEILKAYKDEANNEFFSIDINNQKLFVCASVSEHTNFHYFIVSPRENINMISSMLTSLIIGIFIFIFLLILLLVGLTIFIFFRPINQLFNGMKSVQNGDFSFRLPQNSNYEISYINEHFNLMAENIQRLIHKNYEQEILRKDAEIRNIQNQLNEHFLYNTLDSIRWSARVEDAPQTSEMVYSLATFYRINLSSGSDFVPISQIVQMIKSYLAIQKIRMGDQFTYSLVCDSELSEFRALKYLFQPLIENSLIHGTNGITRSIDIKIVFEISKNNLHFYVSDNGVGISEEKKEEILNSIRDNSEDNSKYFALKIIYEQLSSEYRSGDTLIIETELGKYFSIGFCIPLAALGGTYYDSNDNY